jgi:nitrate/nitrite-specific signal transduction histidine kinase
MANSGADSGEKLIHAAARFSRAYLIALLLIAVLVGSSHVILRMMVTSQAHGAHEIHVSGAQRMLSQRIALLMTELVASPDDPTLLAELTDARDAFAARHDALIKGSNKIGGTATGELAKV